MSTLYKKYTVEIVSVGTYGQSERIRLDLFTVNL